MPKTIEIAINVCQKYKNKPIKEIDMNFHNLHELWLRSLPHVTIDSVIQWGWER